MQQIKCHLRVTFFYVLFMFLKDKVRDLIGNAIIIVLPKG